MRITTNCLKGIHNKIFSNIYEASNFYIIRKLHAWKRPAAYVTLILIVSVENKCSEAALKCMVKLVPEVFKLFINQIIVTYVLWITQNSA